MDISLRLIEGRTPSGEIRALDLGRISAALHEISIRLGRSRVQATGPGRSWRSVEQLNEVRLVGLSVGTLLTFAVGPPDMLPLEIEDTAAQDAELERILIGLAQDRRPDGVPDIVADSVADLVHALQVASTQVELSVAERVPLLFATAGIRRETWMTPRRSIGHDTVAVSGLLEKVDIHAHDLRIRDVTGNTLELTHVGADRESRDLIGSQVYARGLPVRDRDDRLVGLESPTVTACELQTAPDPATAINFGS